MTTDETYEQVATLAQKYVAKNPVLVLGTGATIPHGIPSMANLAVHLLDKIKVDVTDPDSKIWDKFKKILEDSKDLETALSKVILSQPLLTRVLGVTWSYINKKDLVLFRKLLNKPKVLSLSRLIRFLITKSPPTMSIVTTNYDRVAEYATNIAEAKFRTGFSHGYLQRFESNTAMSGSKVPDSTVSIIKVHGSLDWFKDEMGDPLSVPLANKIPKGAKPLIVTPGISKHSETQLEPFRDVMGWADSAMINASSFLCIGYGFNDDHVQPKLTRRVTKNDIPIIVVTKSLSIAGRNLFLNGQCKNYLIIESDNNGTKAYYPDAPKGVLLPKMELWKLEEFNNMIQRKEGD